MQPGIRSVTVQNLLSFGEATTIDLRPLNVLIGPNGSGKSNLIEVLGLLQNAPGELATAISNGGPIEDWLWKGANKTPVASIHITVTRPAELKDRNPKHLRYRLAFTKSGFRFQIINEFIEDEGPLPDQRALDLGMLPPNFYYGYVNGHATFINKGEKVPVRFEDINPQLSILAQRKDPEHYPEITHLGKLFARFRLYRDWEFGTISNIREPCDAGLPNEYLAEDGSNLGVVLDRLLAQPVVKRQVLESLRTFYGDAADLRTTVENGKVQTRLEEAHLQFTIPLVRMSDGTIRWLALLAILLNPDPPPLVCIEEPELGLHPDMIHELAKLLVRASSRMQLIVTTHSERLIEELSEMPEAVIVCEKQSGSSILRRLSADKLSSWLKEYSLGELWTKGQLGGTRW
ncbi:MAG TPA: AAA family ATPase [Bryobacteraceae bacterium]|nr:AAA family ATPase [Bryobacteraceae bacterium]